jgi:hypothetical protein
VDLQVDTNISEEHTASIFRAGIQRRDVAAKWKAGMNGEVNTETPFI